MKIFKILVAGTLVVILMSLMAGSAFAAQGQITEVNPSGIVNAAAVHDLVDPPAYLWSIASQTLLTLPV